MSQSEYNDIDKVGIGQTILHWPEDTILVNNDRIELVEINEKRVYPRYRRFYDQYTHTVGPYRELPYGKMDMIGYDNNSGNLLYESHSEYGYKTDGKEVAFILYTGGPSYLDIACLAKDHLYVINKSDVYYYDYDSGSASSEEHSGHDWEDARTAEKYNRRDVRKIYTYGDKYSIYRFNYVYEWVSVGYYSVMNLKSDDYTKVDVSEDKRKIIITYYFDNGDKRIEVHTYSGNIFQYSEEYRKNKIGAGVVGSCMGEALLRMRKTNEK